MALPKSLGELGLNTIGEAVAFAAGFAAGRALEPIGVALAQEAWTVAPLRAVDAGTAAEVVAEDVRKRDWGAAEAVQHGIDGDRFDAIVGEVLNAPGMGELLAMLRRESITPDEFVHGLRKAKLETRWDAHLEDLQHERLDPAVIATSIQRGIIRDPGFLPTPLDFAGSDVPEPRVSVLSAQEEAKASGIDMERLGVMTRIVGLPPAPGELLQLLNRGEINEAAYRMGIAEGNTRDEWAGKLLTLRRRLLTPHEYAELNLRGVITPSAMHAGAALSGMERADADLLFEVLGRPLNVHEITTGLARGGKFGGVYEGVPEPYVDAIRRSSIRPEYGNLAYANRYTFPSAFVLRALAHAGELPPADVRSILLDLGWRPDLAEKVSRVWTAGTAAKADPHIVKADGHLWTALHKSYVAEESDEAAITPGLQLLAVADIAGVLSRWNAERALIHAQLTPAQIKKAHANLPAVWPRQRALDALLARGYNADEAATLLDE